VNRRDFRCVLSGAVDAARANARAWRACALALINVVISSAATAQTSGRLPVIAILSPDEVIE
jgi:hypothetical protein